MKTLSHSDVCNQDKPTTVYGHFSVVFRTIQLKVNAELKLRGKGLCVKTACVGA